MKKIYSILLAAMMMVATLSACSTGDGGSSAGGSDAASTAQDGGAKNNEDIHVGIVVKSMASQYWMLLKSGAEAKAEELGVKLDCVGPNSESDVQAQVDMIDNLIAQQIDALCVAPSSQDAVLGSLQTAHSQNIPILTVDTDVEFDGRMSFIGTGNESAARLGGEAAAAAVPKGSKVVIIRGRLGDITHDQREKGFQDAMNATGMEVIEIKAADSDTEKAMNIMQDLLQVHSDIGLILSTTDDQAVGAQRAVEAAGTTIPIMGFDGTSSVCALIQEGKIFGSVAQNPYGMGELAVENAVKAVKGETVEPRIDSGAEVITKENVDRYLAELESRSK